MLVHIRAVVELLFAKLAMVQGSLGVGGHVFLESKERHLIPPFPLRDSPISPLDATLGSTPSRTGCRPTWTLLLCASWTRASSEHAYSDGHFHSVGTLGSAFAGRSSNGGTIFSLTFRIDYTSPSWPLDREGICGGW